MNADKYIWSRYDSSRLMSETLALARAEYEVNMERGRDISKDDILNLRIQLESCKDVNDLL